MWCLNVAVSGIEDKMLAGRTSLSNAQQLGAPVTWTDTLCERALPGENDQGRPFNGATQQHHVEFERFAGQPFAGGSIT